MKNFLIGFISGVAFIFIVLNFYFPDFYFLDFYSKEKNQSVAPLQVDTRLILPTYAENNAIVANPEKDTSQAHKKPGNPITATTPTENEVDHNDVIDEITNFQNFLRAIPDSDAPSFAKTTFSSEAIDVNWAANHQNTLDGYFKNEPELQQITPETIECKTSLCKISITATEEEKNTISVQVLTALRKNKNDIPVKVIFDRNPIGLDIYIPRSTNGFFQPL